MRKISATMDDWKVEYKNLEIATKETQVYLSSDLEHHTYHSLIKYQYCVIVILATPAASEGTSISIPLAFNFGRMLQTDEFARRKRTPQEPSSLQALLANHRIDTNVLKTRAQLRQPAQLSTILTPNRDSRLYHISYIM